MKITIRRESPTDFASVRNLHREAFKSEVEGMLVDELRECDKRCISLIAEDGGLVVGHVLFSSVTIRTDAKSIRVQSLAPMAVLPVWQRKGIGSQLVQAGLDECRRQGETIVLVLGHPDFYPRFGFSATLAAPLESPFGSGPAWMALELVPGALSEIVGRVQYPPPFNQFL